MNKYFILFYLIVSEPIAKGLSWKYISGDRTDSWFNKDHDDSTWDHVTGGSNIPNPISTIQYYRYIFSISDISTLAGFTLGIQYTGLINVYINGDLRWTYDSTRYYDYDYNCCYYIYLVIKKQKILIFISIYIILNNNKIMY